MVSNDSKLATPQHGSLALWAAIFRQRMQARGWKAMDLKSKELSSRTVESYVQAEHTPRQKALRQLLKMTRQGVRSKPPLWDTDAELLDWNALLGYTGHATLDLWQNKVEGLMDGQAEIDRLIAQHHWWLDNPALQHVPRLDYFPRDLESEVRHALVALRGFRDPAWRAVLISGSERAERCGLLIHVVQDTMVHEFFRDGIYWVSAGGSLEQMFRALDEQLGSRARHSDPQTAWHTFATNPDHNALVVVEQATPMRLEALFREAGPQIRFLIEAPDLALITPLVTRWLGLERVKSLTLTGYTANEVARLVEARGLTLDETTQTELAKLRECLAGDPLRLRAIVDQWPTGQPFDRAAVYAHLMARQLIQPAPEWLQCEEGTIERPSLMEAIRGALCAAKGQAVVLQGVSGSGKTTLLRLIANDPALRLCFPGTVYYLERKEDGRANLSKQEVRALLLPSDESPDHLHLDELVRRLKTYWRDKSVLLLLDHWHNAEAVRVLQRVLPPQGGLIVTTQTGELAAALGVPAERVIKVEGFTPTEAEAYLARCYELRRHPLTDDVREQFRSWYELNHPLSPLAVRLQINEALGREEEATAFTAMALPSREEPGSETPLHVLLRPVSQAVEESAVRHQQLIKLAYEQLSPAAQACFQRLGALPELQTLDRFAFTALWSSEHELRADEILRELDTQAGLLQRHTDKAGTPFWTMHASVWAYARRLHEMAEPSERQAAAQWLDRAVRTPSQQERYWDFRQDIARLDWRTWWRYFFEHRVPAQVSFWKRQVYRLIKPRYVGEWQAFQEHARYFTSAELMVAYQLYCEERRSNYWVCVTGGLAVATYVLGYLSAPDRFVGMVFLLMLLSCVIVLTRIFTLDMPRIPAWRRLWLTARQRMQSPPPEPEPLAQWSRLIRRRGLARSV